MQPRETGWEPAGSGSGLEYHEWSPYAVYVCTHFVFVLDQEESLEIVAGYMWSLVLCFWNRSP